MKLMTGTTGQQTGHLQHTAQRPVRVIAVTSGKGGVGKTNVSVNLAAALSNAGKKVVLLDADLGLANIDVMLGLNPERNLHDVIKGDCSLGDIVVGAPLQLKVIPASSGIQEMAELPGELHAGLIRAFSDLGHDIDTLIVDTAAGISDSVVSFTCASQEVVVVLCDEPASITDAYALIKLLNRDHGLQRFHILANMVHSVQQGREVYTRLLRTADRFLDVTLDFMGVVPFDDYLRKAVQKQKIVVEAYPRSRAALAFKKLAQGTEKWPMPRQPGGHLEFFVERLIHGREEMA
jgi:flagellar biosynthesis protein FlhG